MRLQLACQRYYFTDQQVMQHHMFKMALKTPVLSYLLQMLLIVVLVAITQSQPSVSSTTETESHKRASTSSSTHGITQDSLDRNSNLRIVAGSLPAAGRVHGLDKAKRRYPRYRKREKKEDGPQLIDSRGTKTSKVDEISTSARRNLLIKACDSVIEGAVRFVWQCL